MLFASSQTSHFMDIYIGLQVPMGRAHSHTPERSSSQPDAARVTSSIVPESVAAQCAVLTHEREPFVAATKTTWPNAQGMSPLSMYSDAHKLRPERQQPSTEISMQKCRCLSRLVRHKPNTNMHADSCNSSLHTATSEVRLHTVETNT